MGSDLGLKMVQEEARTSQAQLYVTENGNITKYTKSRQKNIVFEGSCSILRKSN
jgi:hypothetical protein